MYLNCIYLQVRSRGKAVKLKTKYKMKVTEKLVNA